MSPAPHLDNLNPQQLEAVQHFEGPILVLAGAGSGKTRVLTRRVANLVLEQGVDPQHILAVTFTNKATDEMRERLHSILGPMAGRLWVATFHSAALRILRRHAPRLTFTHDFVVYDEQDARSLLKSILKELSIDEKRFPVSLFSRAIDQAKNALKRPEELAGQAKDYEGNLIADVYSRYQQELAKANAMDFGDLLMHVVLLFRQAPDILALYQHELHFVLVDEFQDTNTVQYEFIRQITAVRKNLLVVGDDDQSIYAFRGATIRNILDFERDFPRTKVVKLEQNYRSTGTILEVAHAVISNNKGRKSKKLWTAGARGTPIATWVGDDEAAEAHFVAGEIQRLHRSGTKLNDVAIFYRTNAQSRALEEALLERRIPYRIFGGLKFYERKEVKDVVAYLRLLVNDADNQSFLRVVNTPPRGIGAQSVQLIVNLAREQNLSLLGAAALFGERNRSVAAFVTLMTELKGLAARLPLGELIRAVLDRSEYWSRLSALKDPTTESRLENLRELESIGASVEVKDLTPPEVLRRFLDRVSLTSSSDLPEGEQTNPEEKPDLVSMMTLHLAKGLEYPYVFLTGLEEGLLPHYRSIEDPTAVEEERRLCYVGITRAMQQLYLSRALQRGMFSSGEGFGLSGRFRKVSRFIAEMPEGCFENRSTDDFRTASLDMYWSASLEEPRYELDGDEGPRRRAVGAERSSTGAPSRRRAPPLLMSADALATPKGAREIDHTVGHERASPELLSAGTKVIHPRFGVGTVERVDGNPEQGEESIKVTVRFEHSERPMKLAFKQAKLALA